MAKMSEWQPIETAPKDGTSILLLMYHVNRKYEKPEKQNEWEAIVEAKWIDFNGGGWTWNGMAGTPKFWKAKDALEDVRKALR